MAHFKYIGRTRQGERTEGVVEAGDRAGAARQIELLGHVPISITETTKTVMQSDGKKKRFNFELGFQRKARMKLQDLLLFSRELSDLVASGMTIGRALHTLAARKDTSAVGRITTTLRDEIVQGTSLSDALELFPETFSSLYVNLVRAGEASGHLPDALENVCLHYERVHEARGKVIGALVYPIIVLVIGSLAVLGMMIFIVPQFVENFNSMGATLPKPTAALMATSSFLMKYGVFVLIALIGLIIVFRRWSRSESGKVIWHRTQLRIPLMGKLIATNAYAHFARTFGTLLQNGVSILPAMGIVQKTIQNVTIANEIGKARERVTDGATISKPLAQSKVFPRLLTDMMAVGEETGDMAGALKHITRRYDAELDKQVRTFTTVLEPLMILLVAAFVGGIAICLLLPILELTSHLNI
ncbi:MAG: type II secretion system F family protein [Pontiellaceae bacterium]|nr:type II secretion system F family protein [Pontiellaceae bacterium]MBN2783388.1 type II secretion system F family protein [Pontiellaceae bacterium]